MKNKNITDKKIKKLFRILLDGKVVQGIDRRGYGIGIIFYRKPYLYWNHYGSSAYKATIENLKLILNVIFKDSIDFCTAHFDDYYINYVPDNKKYKGFDFSTKHPNTFGK